MNSQYGSPKLLLQFYRGEKVPPLVTKYNSENQPNYYMSKQLPKQITKHQQDSQQSYVKTFIKGEKIIQLQNELQRQIQQNRELRLLIKQLEVKIEKLKEINQELIVRVQELQNRNTSLTQNTQNIKRQMTRKIKIQVYKEVQDYLRLSVEKFTQSIINIKMSPVVQNKFQSFLEEILNINSLSVRKALNPVVGGKGRLFDQKQADKTIKQIVDKYEKSKERDRDRDRKRNEQQKYQAIYQKLNESVRPGQIVTRSNSPSKWKSDGKVKRVKIFSNSKGDAASRQNSPERNDDESDD